MPERNDTPLLDRVVPVLSSEKLLKPLMILAGSVVFCVILFFTLGLIGKEHVSWCAVSGPASVRSGRDVQLKVSFFDIREPVNLVVNFHWSDKNGQDRGFLVSGKPVPEIVGDGEHIFTLKVVSKEELGYVQVIVYLSETGSWNDAVRAAHTDMIPVYSSDHVQKESSFNIIPVHPVFDERTADAIKSVKKISDRDRQETTERQSEMDAKLKWLRFSYFAATSFLCFLCFLFNRHAQMRLLWLLSAIILIFLALDSILDLLWSLSGLLRNTAKNQGWYDRRWAVQRWAVAGSVTAVMLLAVFLLRLSSQSMRISGDTLGYLLLLAGLITLLLLAIVRIVSYHLLDKVLRKQVAGLPFQAIVEIAGTLGVWAAVFLTFFRQHVAF